MEQKAFTDYVIPKLLERFPHFREHCIVKTDNIFDIEFNSPSGKLELWLTTQNIEITIGFSGHLGLMDWHMHITTYDDEFLNDDILEAGNVMDEILTDLEMIGKSNTRGYFLWESNWEYKAKEGETVEKLYWSQA